MLQAVPTWCMILRVVGIEATMGCFTCAIVTKDKFMALEMPADTSVLSLFCTLDMCSLDFEHNISTGCC